MPPPIPVTLPARLAHIVWFALCGGATLFFLGYVVEASLPHHPHALVGIFPLIVGGPVGALAGGAGALLAQRGRPRRWLGRSAAIAAVVTALAGGAFAVALDSHGGW